MTPQAGAFNLPEKLGKVQVFEPSSPERSKWKAFLWRQISPSWY